MGRRPNALILQYFERGPKLQDQSNRYPHTCKACGEHFPRGRLDTLTSHLTKKCPAISETDRVNALLTLSGMTAATQRIQGQQSPQPQHPPESLEQPNGSSPEISMVDNSWTALGILAEVSKRIDQNEKIDGGQAQTGVPPSLSAPGGPSSDPLGFEHAEVHQHGQLENQDNHDTADTKAEPGVAEDGGSTLTTEEHLQAALRAEAEMEASNLSVAAAATARLHPLLDPQLLGAEAEAAAEAATAAVNTSLAEATAATTETANIMDIPADPAGSNTAVTSSVPHSPVEQQPVPLPPTSTAQPWGEITYAAEAFQPALVSEATAQSPARMARGGFRLEANGAKSRHSRQRFTPERREQVKDVRKIGACIRCRILRKTCSKGDPCDTCRRVLSPRIWRSGCIRTRFTDQLDIYSASVQIVLAQGQVNTLKQTMTLGDHGIMVDVCHFPDLPSRLRLQVLQRDDVPPGEPESPPAPFTDLSRHPIVMLDSDKHEIVPKLEDYMREILYELINREPSHFVQATLQMALEIARNTNDELLRKALDLWGYVEMLARDRQLTIRIDKSASNEPPEFITEAEGSNEPAYGTICLQLAAAVERRAGLTSKALLTSMQRVLQDSKVKIDFNMYLTTLILLHCVEKSTWGFRAWEQPNLRPVWPLPKEPSTFTQQGSVIADLLRMLLGIRKALPRTARRESDGKLITEESEPFVRGYFEAIDLDFDQVKAKQEKPEFSPTDPKSFEFLFCATLLLPSTD
ncbi:hypothetical protein QBC47DRAFT_371615 [Echria macrotheca]|uniref:Zn(2)-C6 fungal-type domain-containing protein n=1 Tax=Echria macrotheca TaxID=438768 RepID=A0AAJ0BJC5_9PEZI|nr:hypothetical protein QBC47DRAFT_371615 [Echria macrotheca]